MKEVGGIVFIWNDHGFAIACELGGAEVGPVDARIFQGATA